MLRQVISIYILLIFIIISSILLLAFFSNYNAFDEGGACLVAFALYRGAKEFRYTNPAGNKLSDIFNNHQKIALKIDVAIGIIGTLINGFSELLYSIIKLIL